jgi:hypothetical protein
MAFWNDPLSEWGEAWHGWLRGVLLLVSVGVLALVGWMKWLPGPLFGMVLAVVVLLAAWVILLSYLWPDAVGERGKGWTVALSLLAVLPLGVVFHDALYPSPAVVRWELSDTHTAGTVEIAERAPGWKLLVEGQPGVLLQGHDRTISGELRVVQESRVTVLPFSLERGRGPSGPPGRSSGMPNGSAKSVARAFSLGALVPGALRVELKGMKPVDALPIRVSLIRCTVPLLPLQWFWTGLVVMGLVLAGLGALGRSFPVVIPFLGAVAGIGWALSTAFPPEDPVYPLLGILAGAGIPSAALGTVFGWVVYRRRERSA